jgi:hypothetical protein
MRLAYALLMSVGIFTALSSAQAQDPFAATWELNTTKSSFGNPAGGYKGSTLKIEVVGKGQKVVVENIGPSGRPIRYEFTANYDGKEYPLVGMDGTVTLKRVDARTVERVHKNDGVVTLVFMSSVSRDGKTLTLEQTGNPEGRPVKNTIVYDKK